mmetsp:Transcript_15089/g.25610  ORF Transcript_15089/g.25610 Transcript_15089/m.25610 type:complete len:86 (+) Transcript_15089:392-649(+)
MELFKKILLKYEKIFIHDKNYTLIMRLKHTVLKFGLKKLNISYSKISLRDIHEKITNPKINSWSADAAPNAQKDKASQDSLGETE